MSRYTRRAESYDQECRQLGDNWYRMYWTVDYYYSGVRYRFPRQFSRDTDEAGARRFCKKWNIEFPERKA